MTQGDVLGDQLELERSSTAELIAEKLRWLIMEGRLQPGAKISEKDFTQALRVSRNTLREAFRLLAHERLLVHQLNQGVFVRLLDASDVVDLFAVRRLVECSAIRAGGLDSDAAARIDAIVTDAERAAAEGRWGDVGTGNMLYHQAVAGLLGSRRVDELMRQVLAELRLVFHVMSDPRRFHEAYLPRNRAILAVAVAGDSERAERMLHEYLLDAERQLLDAYRSSSG